ncbi:hypothetical protein D8674_037216 [Pyrus ussuriensis x Pyrus communis]|uniref:Uncharacterized protein n=1 Tax=Pyrus ussuriensis x Pyrus communis TaxID=2448454 RepID=A0A5N5G7X5_9ROSA|nr:hypothetical protein D8674_037216 [Pyrus ussuriensis x Pyrus communis]
MSTTEKSKPGADRDRILPYLFCFIRLSYSYIPLSSYISPPQAEHPNSLSTMLLLPNSVTPNPITRSPTTLPSTSPLEIPTNAPASSTVASKSLHTIKTKADEATSKFRSEATAGVYMINVLLAFQEVKLTNIGSGKVGCNLKLPLTRFNTNGTSVTTSSGISKLMMMMIFFPHIKYCNNLLGIGTSGQQFFHDLAVKG